MKPIIFNGEMIRAIQRGWKTQTRRVMNPAHPENLFDISLDDCPFGQKGDRLWVKETMTKKLGSYGTPDLCTYDADRTGVVGTNPPRSYCGRAVWQWKLKTLPSIFMPRWASRITLEITDMCAERLSIITEASAQREGWFFHDIEKKEGNPDLYERYDPVTMSSARDWFRAKWDEINMKRGYSWESNPWVWVLTFKENKDDE